MSSKSSKPPPQHHLPLSHLSHLSIEHNYQQPYTSYYTNHPPTPGESRFSLDNDHVQQASDYSDSSCSGQHQPINCNGSLLGLSLKDFRLVSTLGTGTFGKVLLVSLHHPSPHLREFYAIKVLSKAQVVKLKQVEHVNSEKDLLALVTRLNPPSPNHDKYRQFYVNLLCTFQDSKNLYMLQEFIPGGELFNQLRKLGKFNKKMAQFYGSNVVLGLEGLHSLDIIYRDLKPENILIHLNGYIKLTDFGFAKRIKERTWTLCGTPEYLAPEIIQSKGHGKAADWWAFGILLYEMLAGYPPFFNPDTSLGPFAIYEKIIACDLKFPALLFPQHDLFGFDLYSINLISRLLTVDRSKRLGNLKGGINDVKNHPWFFGIDWALLAQQAIPAPILPKVNRPGDFSNFEKFPEVSLDELPGFQQDPLSDPLASHRRISACSLKDDPFRYLFPTF